MKKKIGCLLFLAPAMASAVEIEIGAGAARYTTRGDMMWYQEGFPHRLDLRAPTFEVGLTGNALQYGRWGLDWRASWVYVGNMQTESLAVSDDNYSRHTKSCIGECKRADKFVTNGHMNGIRLTLEPTYTYNGWKFGVEGGLYIYRPTFHANIYDGDGGPGQWHSNYRPPIQYSPVVGLEVAYRNFSVAYMHYFSRTLRDPYYAAWKATDTITVRYRF